MLIDSHCHLHDSQFFSEEEALAALEKAKQNNVEKIICIGTDPKDSLVARDFAEKHEGVYWTYGIHPLEATNLSTLEPTRPPVFTGGSFCSVVKLDDGEHALELNKLVAIGEVGLDYHYEGHDKREQIRLFEEMLQLAMDNDLPVSFHVREAFDDFFGVIANFPKIRIIKRT